MQTNLIDNSLFLVAQRGASIPTLTDNATTLDRWHFSASGEVNNHTIERVLFAAGQTNVPDDPRYYLQWTMPASVNGTCRVGQPIEFVDTLNGKWAFISFWAWANRDIRGTISCVQDFGSGGGESADVQNNQKATFDYVESQWYRYTGAFKLASTSGKTRGADLNDHIFLRWSFSEAEIEDVAHGGVNAGCVWRLALPAFGPRGTIFLRPSAIEEFDRCHRHYQKIIVETINGDMYVKFSPEMRDLPIVSVTTSSGLATAHDIKRHGFRLRNTSEELATITVSAELR